MSEPKGKRGRPRINRTPEEMQAKVDAYFKRATKTPTICGLALHLGYARRTSLLDGMNRKDEFSDIIKKAVSRVEKAYEERLSKPACAGSIFALKNMGWRDREADGKGDIVVRVIVDRP